MIKAVIFDMDNTLIDFVKFKNKAIDESVNAMINAGLKLKEDEAVKLMHKIYKKTYYESDTIFQEFLNEAINRTDYKILSAAIVAYRNVRTSYLTPYKNVKETLEDLKSKGLRLGVITDAPRIKAWIRLTTIGLVDYFDFVITFDDTLKRKPHRLPFKKAINQLKLKPEQILFVGDNPNRDMKGAKKMGMKTALAKYGQFLEGDESSDAVLEDIKDLIFFCQR
ncbi:MAG: TIGR02253 family HAD-type hydrolase [Nanoarchaeota archaeon]|nr:TIGR02253 family HAD-type hydrolase [Nanoarchaeota archaeon]